MNRCSLLPGFVAVARQQSSDEKGISHLPDSVKRIFNGHVSGMVCVKEK